jgi:hypothetical protein
MDRLTPPAEGLGLLLVGGSNALIEHARPSLKALDEWLRDGGAPSDEIAGLIGLGPGLTPSGDDYLGGVFLGLRFLKQEEKADALWRWLAPRLIERTSALSAAHLAAASQGIASEPVKQCIRSTNPDWKALSAVGHSSGWDALAGVASVAASAAARALDGATSTPAARRIAAWRDQLCGSCSVPVTEATTGF